MAEFYNCFSCRAVYPLLNDAEKQRAEEGTCSRCGAHNGKVISHKEFKEGFEGGVFYNIDPKTGKPAKKKRQ